VRNGEVVASRTDPQGVIVACASCGQANRLRFTALNKTIRCGNCRATLPALSAPVEIADTATFDAAARDSALPLLVDFWAPWCGPCRMIAPILEELAAERRDIRVAKLNVDENSRTSAAFGVQGIPLLVFFKDGVERGRVVGAVPRGQIEAAIRQYFG